MAAAHILPRHNAGTAQRLTLPPPRQRPPCVAESALNSGGSLYRMAHFAEKSWRGILEFQRNSQTRISIPDTPTAETAVTIAQIMSLIIRPYYPRYERPAVQNCTEQGSNRCDLTAGPTGGLLASLAGAVFRVGRRAARPLRKATCQVLASDYSHLVQGRRRAQFLVGKAPVSAKRPGPPASGG